MLYYQIKVICHFHITQIRIHWYLQIRQVELSNSECIFETHNLTVFTQILQSTQKYKLVKCNIQETVLPQKTFLKLLFTCFYKPKEQACKDFWWKILTAFV